MKLGLVSAIYDDVDYEKLIDLVADAGLECVEVACWPVEKAERRYAGVSHINVEQYSGYSKGKGESRRRSQSHV